MKPDTHAGADMLGGISLEAALTKEQAEQIYNQGKEAVVFALLELSKKRAEQQSPPTPAPSTPSGMVRDLLIGATYPAHHFLFDFANRPATSPADTDVSPVHVR